MKCTACFTPIYHGPEENTKNHRCWNHGVCPARVEAVYGCHVSVKPGWWFSEQYHLPFKIGPQWYCVEGYADSSNTYLKKIETHFQHGIIDWNKGNPIWGPRLESKQATVWKVPYMGLPVNDEFNDQFAALLNKFDRYLNKLIVLQERS